MSDNLTTVNTGTGALPVSTTIATRDTGTSHWQQVDVAPASASAVSGAQWALSVGTGADVSLTVPGTATHCWLSVDTGGSTTGVRWCRDSSSLSATTGHLLAPGDAIELDNLSGVRLRAVTASAVVQVSYHRYV